MTKEDWDKRAAANRRAGRRVCPNSLCCFVGQRQGYYVTHLQIGSATLRWHCIVCARTWCSSRAASCHDCKAVPKHLRSRSGSSNSIRGPYTLTEMMQIMVVGWFAWTAQQGTNGQQQASVAGTTGALGPQSVSFSQNHFLPYQATNPPSQMQAQSTAAQSMQLAPPLRTGSQQSTSTLPAYPSFTQARVSTGHSFGYSYQPMSMPGQTADSDFAPTTDTLQPATPDDFRCFGASEVEHVDDMADPIKYFGGIGAQFENEPNNYYSTAAANVDPDLEAMGYVDSVQHARWRGPGEWVFTTVGDENFAQTQLQGSEHVSHDGPVTAHDAWQAQVNEGITFGIGIRWQPAAAQSTLGRTDRIQPVAGDSLPERRPAVENTAYRGKGKGRAVDQDPSEPSASTPRTSTHSHGSGGFACLPVHHHQLQGFTNMATSSRVPPLPAPTHRLNSTNYALPAIGPPSRYPAHPPSDMQRPPQRDTRPDPMGPSCGCNLVWGHELFCPFR